MSSKKVMKATISYAELFKRVPPEQARNLKILFDKNKGYKERLMELPEELPKINWEFYKLNVRSDYIPLVEEFEKKYNDVKIPYPEDPYTAQIDEMKQVVECEVEQFNAESNCRIQQHEEKICEVLSRIPFEEMTMEEYCYLYPDDAPDFINRPTFWPHTKDDQLPTPEEIEAERLKVEEAKKTELAAEEAAKTKSEEKAAKTDKKEKDKKEAKPEKPEEKKK